MKKEIIQTGKTVDAAIEQACAELGLPRDEVEFEIIDLPKKGFLGLKSYPAKVRVFSIKEEPIAPKAPAPRMAAPKMPAENRCPCNAVPCKSRGKTPAKASCTSGSQR